MLMITLFFHKEPFVRRTFPKWALVLIPFLLPSPHAAAAEPLDTAAVDRQVDDALDFWRVPGTAVAIVRDDKVIYLKGHGFREIGHKDPVTPDTLFPIASCTKAFTTTALAMLVDEGKLSWDEPVRRHVPYFHLHDPSADALVTLRDLVCHRTGLGSHELLWYRSSLSQEEIIRRIAFVQPSYPFRSGFRYQSTMFTTAGHAVAAAAGIPWDEFVRKRILEPLDMKRVTLTTPAAEKDPDHAIPHRHGTFGQPMAMPWYKMTVPEPAGSIDASARDLCQWVRFQLGDGTFGGKRLVSTASLDETHLGQNLIRMEGTAKAMNPETIQMSYGMAWVIQDYRGLRLISHAGAIDGFRAHLTLVPRERLGIVVLTNMHQTRMNLALSNRLVDLLLGLKTRDWNAFYLAQARQEELEHWAQRQEWESKRKDHTNPSRELAAYAGSYEEPAYGTCEVTVEQGKLVWKWSSFKCPLTHFHYDTFVAQDEVLGGPRMVFTLGADGEVTTLRVVDVLGVEFRRVKGK